MAVFLAALAAVFIAEMGDKTQLLLVAMAGKYKVRDILIGTWAATIVLNLLAVGVGAALSQYLDMRIIKSVAAAAFFYFSWSTLKDINDDEEEGIGASSARAAVLAIFGTFFIGELGDKTQLSAITLAAAYTNGSILNSAFVFAGCTLGLILADLIGLLAGLFLKSKMPTRGLNILSTVIFAIFGILNCLEAGMAIFPPAESDSSPLTTGAIVLAASAGAAFALLMAVTALLVARQKGRGEGQEA